jgi:flagellar export protein FliJ
MKKFKFSLETVHKVREIRREKESVILSGLREDAEKAADRVAHIEAMRHAAIENHTRRLGSGESLNVTEMELSSNHFASLNRLQRDAETVLELKRQECQRQVELVTKAMVKVKVTDNLRETQHERYKQEFARQEQNGVDELVSATFARQLLQSK